MRIQSFKPVIDERSRILILGSMPGRASLESGHYYAHPQNRFWPLMMKLLNGGQPIEDYEQRLQLLLDNGIALWDVCESCEREGSLDKAIMAVDPNDIPALLEEYKGIERIIFNGSAAREIFKQNFNLDIPTHMMPSTSPVPRRYIRNFDDVARVWGKLMDWLEPEEKLG